MDNEELINKAIGLRIVVFRKSHQMTRTQMAKALEITQQQLDKYEKGINRISAAKLAIISQKFEVDISYFYEDILSRNQEEIKLIKENVNLLISYYLNIKNEENRYLIVALARELAKNQ